MFASSAAGLLNAYASLCRARALERPSARPFCEHRFTHAEYEELKLAQRPAGRRFSALQPTRPEHGEEYPELEVLGASLAHAATLGGA